MIETVSSADRIRALCVLAATIGTVVINSLAAAGFINNVTPADISERYETLLTPAGYAFSIWSLIYVGLIGFSILQLVPKNVARFRGLRTIYILTCVLNCGWIYFWHHELIAAAFVTIVALTVALIVLNDRLSAPAGTADVLLLHLPFGLYAGWVTAATIVSFSILLRYMEVPAGAAAASILILVGAGVAVAARIILGKFVFALAMAWAITAIAVKQSGNTPIVVAAAAAVVICLVTAGTFVTRLEDSTSGRT